MMTFLVLLVLALSAISRVLLAQELGCTLPPLWVFASPEDTRTIFLAAGAEGEQTTKWVGQPSTWSPATLVE
jgi:hypothetical protein